jgi:RNA polymerase sigma factor (sigma-70 family)
MKEESKYPNIHQALIDLCKRGDSKAQFEIYKLYYKAMYNTCLRMVQDTNEAEDIMQDAFFKAFDKINTYRNEVSFGAWLRRIVVNTALDYLKKAKLLLTPLDDVHNLNEKSIDENQDFEPESVEQLYKAIGQLPEGFRLVVTLFYLEDYSHDEIAEALGITSSTSRSQLARAKQKLIEIMKVNSKAH